MKEIIAVSAVVLTVLAASLAFFSVDPSLITGEVVAHKYSYTKAVCNSTNYCEDFVITCDGEDVVSVIPTGDTVQLPDHWVDPRDNEIIEGIC